MLLVVSVNSVVLQTTNPYCKGYLSEINFLKISIVTEQ
jgi:hypothetical protein